MAKIIEIYLRDLRRISTNWAAAVIILGLVCLPSLYAWFNIEASWDPYGSTSGIQIAVTNLDEGAELQKQPVNMGNEIIESLKSNSSIGWIFTSHESARKGLRHGDYYATLEIPKDFSTKIVSVLTPNPIKAEIVYEVNEKINAVAPKITSKGASSIIEEVNRNFVKTANGTIFRIFNQIGIELKRELPVIEKMKRLVYKLESMFPEIYNATDTALADLQETQKLVSKVQKQIPTVVDLAQKGSTFSTRLSQFLGQVKVNLEDAAPSIKLTLTELRQVVTSAQQIAESIPTLKPDDPLLKQKLDALNHGLITGVNVTKQVSSFISKLNEIAPSQVLSKLVDNLNNISAQFTTLQQQLVKIEHAASSGNEALASLLADFSTLATQAGNKLDEILAEYDSRIVPKIKSAINQATQAAETSRRLLESALADIPKVEHLLSDATKGLELGTSEAKKLRVQLPEAQSKIKRISDQMRAFEKEGSLSDLIELLSINYQKESDFFAEPVALIEHKLFPIPNYGSAMSPFFTTLSFWVGGLLLVSLLTVEVHEHDVNYRSYQIYLGRFLTFGTLALLQSLLVTTGDLYILGTYAVSPIWFILFGMGISLVFMLMIYTLVSVFGNVGKAMAIVLLVLQLAGSGGTFPIQVTPPFFQAIYPFLPFTYGISLLREAVGGIVSDLIVRDVLMLTLFTAVALVVGIALKKSINHLSKPLVAKARRSKIIH
ncbi:putative membrane protein [Paenibacillus shirakamiensis]|uniref:Membrane protein n=1 Tax=Paenibacillus shirakamiensis TaxID=1265935 RepID=A0ABS4JH02_9BACL|nr:YhgE/Pip domain-containing protein [Paenibacillus shirakamiensis]MBP2000993.1 putative membrane protein [Paenibacillus shirakamiensis]